VITHTKRTGWHENDFTTHGQARKDCQTPGVGYRLPAPPRGWSVPGVRAGEDTPPAAAAAAAMARAAGDYFFKVQHTPWGSVALSLCLAARPLYTSFTKIIGASFSEATVRPNPRSATFTPAGVPTATRAAAGGARRPARARSAWRVADRSPRSPGAPARAGTRTTPLRRRGSCGRRGPRGRIRRCRAQTPPQRLARRSRWCFACRRGARATRRRPPMGGAARLAPRIRATSARQLRQEMEQRRGGWRRHGSRPSPSAAVTTSTRRRPPAPSATR
jgi:hypothetical protein